MIHLREICQDAKCIAIGGHVRPDGDCVGSTTSLYLYLKKIVPTARVVLILEQPSPVFLDLKGVNEIYSDFNEDINFDVFFALDTVKDRLGVGESYFDKAITKVNIDHHISNNGSGDFNYIDFNASSTCELVYDLLEEEYIDEDIAKAIYIGMIHDTGVFQYSNTSPKTLITASKLIGYGFDFSEIIDKTFYEKTYVQSQIMGRAILESFLLMDGKCAVSCITKKELEFYEAGSQDLEGIVNQLRIIKGVECAVFMHEIGTLEYKVSMRSTDRVNVSKVAVYFGGGGHKKAAGCTMRGTFHDVINNLTKEIVKQLGEK